MRLEVTRKSDLAVRTLRALADGDGRRKGSDLAAAVGSTAGFVAQVITPLVRAGWVRSEPGPTGGYSLAVPLKKVSILAVIEAVEGPTDAGRCVLVDRLCGDTGECALHGPWMRARRELLNQLDRVSVADASLMELIR